jgi:hypothetical protein
MFFPESASLKAGSAGRLSCFFKKSAACASLKHYRSCCAESLFLTTSIFFQAYPDAPDHAAQDGNSSNAGGRANGDAARHISAEGGLIGKFGFFMYFCGMF